MASFGTSPSYWEHRLVGFSVCSLFLRGVCELHSSVGFTSMTAGVCVVTMSAVGGGGGGQTGNSCLVMGGIPSRLEVNVGVLTLQRTDGADGDAVLAALIPEATA